jgi:lipopolysaccharide export LptBFGC system permease protein LptF
MRMSWWTAIFFLAVQAMLVQYMVETFLAGHKESLPPYLTAMGVVLVLAAISLWVFRKLEKVRE